MFTFATSKSGLLTCYTQRAGQEFWMHSKYDPAQEAARTVRAQLSLATEPFEKLIVYGLGCGHHLRVLLQESCMQGKILEVWETNLEFFHEVSKQEELQDLLHDPRLRIRVSDDLQAIAQYVVAWEHERPFLLIHEPSLRLIPDHLKSFQEMLTRYKIFLNGIASFSPLLDENFQANEQRVLPSIGAFVGTFTGVPFLLISAGPSLQKNLHLVQRAKRHCLIGCVGTALRPLLQTGVEPDFMMITDPKEQVYRQIEGLPINHLPLFFLSTAFQGVAKHHQGPSFVVYQQGYESAEVVAAKRGVQTIQTGGSVSTSIFELALLFGANPLCLIGQDLAYTDSKSHIQGTDEVRTIIDLQGTEQVESFSREGTVPTVRNLLVYRDFLQRRAKEVQETLFNATEGGAYIEGFQHVTLESFLEHVRQVEVEPARKCFERLVQGRN